MSEIHEAIPAPIINTPHDQTKSLRYGVLVWNYALGQLRIQVTDSERPDHWNKELGHGAIVRQL